MDNKNRRRRMRRHEKGAVAVMVALSLLALLCVAAMAIEIARWVAVRHELQNAADAAALAGVQTLPGQLAGSAVAATWSTATPLASAAAAKYASANTANGQAASLQSVAVGYWDVANMPSSLPSSLSQTVLSTTDKPAVLVTVGLAGGKDLPLTLGSMFGVSSMHVSATAVAIISTPGTALPGSLFPIAMNQCVYQNPAYWNNGQPVASQEIAIGNGALSTSAPLNNCQGVAAQWSVFTLDKNPGAYGPCKGDSPSSQGTAPCLMVNGNGPAISVGNSIDIQPGVKSSIYNNFPSQVQLPLQVTLPVVADGPIMSGGGGGDTPIVAFAGFQIDCVIGANGNTTPAKPPAVCLTPPCTKCVIGHLIPVNAASLTAAGPLSPYYGAITPPRLAQLPSDAWY